MMRQPRIGLIGRHSDVTCRRLADQLSNRRVDAFLWDLEAFPHDLALIVTDRGVRVGDQKLEDCDALYVAKGEYMTPVPTWVPQREHWDRYEHTIGHEIRFRQESRSVRASVLNIASERSWVANPAAVHRACALVPSLLRQLAANGIQIAPFVSGNDLEKMAFFVYENGEQCRGRRLTDPPSKEAKANLSYLKEHHNDFDVFPVIIRRVMGEERIAALVVGSHCFGMSCAPARVEGHSSLDDRIRKTALRVAEIMGAPLLRVFFELDGEGAPWLIGVDAEPPIAALEDETGHPLIETLADLLLKNAMPSGLSFNRNDAMTVHIPPIISKTRKRIGLAGQIGNAEIAAVKAALEERGAIPLPVELPLFPDRRALHECSSGGRIGRTSISDLDAVFLRSTGVTSPLKGEDDPKIDYDSWPAMYKKYTRFVGDQGDCLKFKYAVLDNLSRRIPVINPPIGQEVHRIKVWQIFTLMRAGFSVPPTIAGNDRDQLAAFIKAQGGEEKVVLKPLAGIYKTCLLSDIGLSAALKAGPIVLQRYIAGDTIRAYIVGDKLAGAGKIIHNGSSVDSSVEQTGVEPFSLPQAAIDEGAKAAKHLRLYWTGMDFMLERSTQKFFILECNAAAMFANFSRITGYDVPGALADLLMGL